MPDVLTARGSLGGTTLRSRDVGGFTLSETRHPPRMRLPRHANDRATLVAVLGGAYVETAAGRTGTHLPGTLLVRPAGEVHSNALDGRGSRCLLVELSPGRLEACGGLFGDVRAFAGSPAAALALRAAEELGASDAAAPLALEALALELVAALARQPSGRAGSPPRWLEAIRQTVHEAPSGVTLASLAREAGYAPVYVARAFRRHFGCSVGEYLRRRRVEIARDALALSDAPLAAIALDAGFFDQSHFSRVFRRHLGLTPAAYRRLHREVRPVPAPVARVQDGRWGRG
ncbi:MAG: helix-turn-helix domain-containing protein [Longimicrobiaceae bacterium]